MKPNKLTHCTVYSVHLLVMYGFSVIEHDFRFVLNQVDFEKIE